MPLSSIRKGYSLVPWVEPRYLTIPQPAGGDLLADPVVQQDDAVGDVLLQAVAGEQSSPRSAVMMAVTPFSFSQRKSRRSSARRMPRWARPAKSASRVSSTTRLAPTESMAEAEADEEPFQVVFARLLDLAPLDVDVVDGELLPLRQVLQVEAQGGDVLGQLFGRLLEGHEDARLVVLGGAA